MKYETVSSQPVGENQAFNGEEVTYFQIFRLIFVLSFFYVLGDAIYRGEGFIYYYASYSEFFPTVSLVSLFWSSLSVIVSILLWISCITLVRVSRWVGLKIRAEHYLIFVGTFFSGGAIAWILKRYFLDRGVTLFEKTIIFSCLICLTIYLSWLSRNKVVNWFNVLIAVITPIAWLLGIVNIFFLIIVLYYS